MRRMRSGLLAVALVLLALVVQSTLFRRFRFLTPDLVLLVVILSCLSLRPEGALILGFGGGLLVDLAVGNTVIGLRALSYTAVAYVAVRTRERTDVGMVAVGIWAGALTLVGVILFLVLGTLFGQAEVIGGQPVRRMLQVPLTNAVLGALLGSSVARLVGSGRHRV
jgi:rod shape-determining protein MreD